MKKNQETDGYERDKRPETKRLKMKQRMITKTRKKTETKKKPQSICVRNHSIL